MRFRLIIVTATWLAVSSTGCGLRRPFERPPGTIDSQRSAAAEHDPYADNDAGPEVVGGRPREFAKPRPEPVRNRPQPVSQNNVQGWLGGWFGG